MSSFQLLLNYLLYFTNLKHGSHPNLFPPELEPLDFTSLLLLSDQQNRNGHLSVFPISWTVILNLLGAADSPGYVASLELIRNPTVKSQV